jgi:hypothetical protein
MLSIKPNSPDVPHLNQLTIISSAEHAGIDPLTPCDDANLSLAPEEIATLSSLMSRYDRLLVEMDALSEKLEELLKVESPSNVPPKPESR